MRIIENDTKMAGYNLNNLDFINFLFSFLISTKERARTNPDKTKKKSTAMGIPLKILIW